MAETSWILPVIGSSVSWALSDVLCDICIGEESDDEDEERIDPPTWKKVKTHDEESLDPKRRPALKVKSRRVSIERANGFVPDSKSANTEIEMTDIGFTGVTVNSEVASDAFSIVEKNDHIDSEQDCAIAGLVSMVVMYMICLKRWNRFIDSGSEQALMSQQLNEDSGVDLGIVHVLLWSAFEDLEWWLAAVGGGLLFLHYLTLLWAYDKAPSTVINPLIQVSSVWVLLGSAVPSALLGNAFIRPFDLFCYVIIIIGGLLPSLEGNIKDMLKVSFWMQPYVRNIVLSEVALGLYDLVVSYSLQTSSRKLKFQALDAAALEDEFFFVAWCWFVIVFALSFAFHPRLRRKLNALQYNIPVKVLAWSSVGQLLTMLGYYVSAFAYAWYYQASVVHAAETSLQQALNLLLAFFLRKVFNLGRPSAIKGMKFKILSCLVVTAGLFLVALQDVYETVEVHELPSEVPQFSTMANATRLLLGSGHYIGTNSLDLVQRRRYQLLGLPLP